MLYDKENNNLRSCHHATLNDTTNSGSGNNNNGSGSGNNNNGSGNNNTTTTNTTTLLPYGNLGEVVLILSTLASTATNKQCREFLISTGKCSVV